MLQRVAVRYRQCVTACHNKVQECLYKSYEYVYVAVYCSVLQCVAVCCSVLQSVVGSVLQCVTTKSKSVCPSPAKISGMRDGVCCSVLQCVAVCCSVLQCVAA